MQHIKEIMEICHPNKRKIVRDLARFYRVHRVEILDDPVRWVERLQEEEPELRRRYEWDFSSVRDFEEKRTYARKKPKRPILHRGRPGEPPYRPAQVADPAPDHSLTAATNATT